MVAVRLLFLNQGLQPLSASQIIGRFARGTGLQDLRDAVKLDPVHPTHLVQNNRNLETAKERKEID